ncbi:MAG: T9SS type A sorting domain-containing protein [Lewinellaceae bacterium]|nr:T9SS type A sorting domain-containing protein [Lewinellaceae bacterium]
MKNYFTAFCFLLVFSASAQSWSVGTSWYYQEDDPFPFWHPVVVNIQLTADTIIDGYPTFAVEGGCSCGLMEPQYLRRDGDQVFYYESGQFRLLYDFALGAGDTLHVEWGSNPVNYFVVMIDSVSYLYLPNGDSLKVQHIIPYDTNDLQHWAEWGDRIIEGIGGNYCLYPMWPTCDPQTYGLLCHETQAGVIYPIGATGTCMEIVDAEEAVLVQPEIMLMPSLTENYTRVKSSHLISRYWIFDAAGRKMGEGLPESAEFEVSVRALPPGVYFMQFSCFGGQKVQRKFIRIRSM